MRCRAVHLFITPARDEIDALSCAPNASSVIAHLPPPPPRPTRRPFPAPIVRRETTETPSSSVRIDVIPNPALAARSRDDVVPFPRSPIVAERANGATPAPRSTPSVVVPERRRTRVRIAPRSSRKPHRNANRNAHRNARRTHHDSRARVDERPRASRATRPSGGGASRPTDRWSVLSDRPMGRLVRPTDRASCPTDRWSDRPMGRPTDRATDRPIER